ncbi:MAG TPA: cytochrome P450 [Streptosporangiaceae bacterium]|jgi:cytochrome P450
METEASQVIERVPVDIMQDPYGILEKLRAAGPVREVVWAHGAKVWLVTRYEEIRALVNDPRVSKDGRRINELFAVHSGIAVPEDEAADVGFDEDLATHLLNSDPPRHTRLRSLVSKAFNVRQVERLRPRVEEVADRLLDAMEGQSDVDLVPAFAVRLPITIICDLFGIPEQDREQFRLWGTKLVGAGQDPDEVAEAGEKMVAYVSALVDDKRANPQDDMISELTRVRDEDGDKLTQGELVSMIFFVAVAGHITTIYTLGNAVYNLLNHPDELAKLRGDLSLMSAAVDELMRYDSAAQVGTFRFTTDDIPIGDVVIPSGQLLLLSWSSANRDSSHFPDADRLDVARRPQGIMSFGHGLHHCIGVPLAKMQIEIALTKLITRYPDLRLAVDRDQIRWEDGALLRGLISLPVAVTPLDPAVS